MSDQDSSIDDLRITPEFRAVSIKAIGYDAAGSIEELNEFRRRATWEDTAEQNFTAQSRTAQLLAILPSDQIIEKLGLKPKAELNRPSFAEFIRKTAAVNAKPS